MPLTGILNYNMIVSNHLLLYNHDGSKKPKSCQLVGKHREIRKLECAMALLDVDEHMAAGLYTYAIEELGKNSSVDTKQ